MPGASARARWQPILLLLAGTLILGLYPVDRALIAAVQQGDRAAAAGRYSEALRAYEASAQRCPGCPQPLLRQGAAYVAQGRYDRAQTTYLTAIRKGGPSDAAIDGLAALHAAEESERLAINELEGLVARRPGRSDWWVRLGEAYLASDEQARARQAFERALVLEVTEAQRQVLHDRLGALCLVLDGDERGAECALAHWADAERGPDVALAENAARLVQALLLWGQADESNDLALARARLGEALYRHGDLELARRQFEAALDLEPAYVDAHAYLGHVLSLLGENEASVAHLEQAIALAPDYTLPRYFLGMHYVRRGWWVTGREVLEQAYDLDPSDPAICAAIADAHLRGDTPWYEVAEQWFLAAVERAPNDPRFHLLLAQFYVVRGIDPGGRGVTAARAAVELAPQNSEAHETLGWAYHLSGRSQLALEPLERALDLAQNEPRTQPRTRLRTRTSWARLQYRLGEVYRALGRSEQARQHLERAVDLDWHGAIGDRARGALPALQ